MGGNSPLVGPIPLSLLLQLSWIEWSFFLFPSEVQFENLKKKKKGDDKRNCEEKPKTQKDNNGTQFRVHISELTPRWTEVEFPSSLARTLVLLPLRIWSDFQPICQEEIPDMSQIHQCSPLAQITSTAQFSLTVIHLGTLKGSEPTLWGVSSPAFLEQRLGC